MKPWPVGSSTTPSALPNHSTAAEPAALATPGRSRHQKRRAIVSGPISRGFRGRRRVAADSLPPGQYATDDFPVLSAGPTPRPNLPRWRFTLVTEAGERREWTWHQFRALP